MGSSNSSPWFPVDVTARLAPTSRPLIFLVNAIVDYNCSESALPDPTHRGEGDAHLHSKCTTRQAHTHRAYETALALLSSPISDMLSHLTYPGRCHTPPRSSASCGRIRGL